MIEEGILSRLITSITRENARLFLIVIEQFEGNMNDRWNKIELAFQIGSFTPYYFVLLNTITDYQEELLKDGMLKPLIRLLADDDIQIQTRISDFIMNFEG